MIISPSVQLQQIKVTSSEALKMGEDWFPRQKQRHYRGAAAGLHLTWVMVDIICRRPSLTGGGNGSRHDTESPAPKPAT